MKWTGIRIRVGGIEHQIKARTGSVSPFCKPGNKSSSDTSFIPDYDPKKLRLNWTVEEVLRVPRRRYYLVDRAQARVR